jgi:hypothetical protein
VATRRSQQTTVAASLTPERAKSALKTQLATLQEMRGKHYYDAESTERQWVQLTARIVAHAFGDPSPNLSSLYHAKSAGDYRLVPFGEGVDPGWDQRNFDTRIQALEDFLRACLDELDLTSPESEIQSAYAPGDEYEFYKDMKNILSSAKSSILVIDPYLSKEIFEVYVDGINRSVKINILTDSPPPDAMLIAAKYSAGGNLAMRASKAIHDRVIFADNRVWMVGQSLKDAAKKKPTYIVEHDAELMLPLYKDIWNKATVLL